MKMSFGRKGLELCRAGEEWRTSNIKIQGWRYPEQEQSIPVAGVMSLMAYCENLKKMARSLKTEIGVLSLALRDPRTPWYAKGLGSVQYLSHFRLA